MSTNGEQAYALYEAAIGQDQGFGDWFLVDQARIDAFADVTLDPQFIHIDPAKAAELSPYGVTIAHGFLTLSLLSYLSTSIPVPSERTEGRVMGINYGCNKVRFINAVKVDSRIRAGSVLKAVELKDPNTLQLVNTVTVEIEGESRPAMIADWVSRAIYG